MYILFYLPPCGRWYVHSHKLYETTEQVHEAAKQFLQPGATYAVAEAPLVMEALKVPL